ncbi:MAG: polysaccharide deacetylase family protein [Gemmatimonadales bacterium]
MKRAAHGVVWRSGMLVALRWLHRARLPILCYHSVLEDAMAVVGPDPLLHLPARDFGRQLEFLARHYRVISLVDAVEQLRAGGSPPPRSVVLTFDDGYANNVHVAAPLLAQHGFPATIFLATDYVGRDRFWWDDPRAQGGRAEQLRAASLDERRQLLAALGPEPGRSEALRPATWEECRAAPANIQFGGHSAAHRLLGEIPSNEARAELDGCRQALSIQLGERAVPIFSYPAGQWTGAVRAALPAAGFRSAVFVGPERRDQRLAGRDDDLMLLPRVGVNGRMPLATFAATVAGLNPVLT